jgi:polyhydroxyalkanoate synthesis regulator phasin
LPNEIELGQKLWKTIDTWIKEGKAKQDAAGTKFNPIMEVATKNSEHWGEMLLERLLRERREMPKSERLARFRNDSVDEVDTTDLEKWSLKKRTK